MINFQEFGTLISKQEWTVIDNKIDSFIYMGIDEEKDYYAIGGNKRDTCGYDCEYSNAEEIRKFSTANIHSLANMLSVLNTGINSEELMPIEIYTYDNAVEKDDDTFNVKISDNVFFTIDKAHKLIIDKRYFAYEEANNNPLEFLTRYEFHDYGFFIENLKESKSYLLNDEISDSGGYYNIILEEIIETPAVITNIPNLSNLPRTIDFVNEIETLHHFELDYDEFGLIKNGYDCLYEAYQFDEYKEPIFVASMHPLFFDNFDTGLVPGFDKMVIDQIDRDIDDENVIIYSREVYQIDDDKKEKLSNLIREAKMKDEPCIPIIN